MTWNEVKVDGYDFCLEFDEWQVRRKGEQVGIWYSPDGQFNKYCKKINWCDDISEGIFLVWKIELRGQRKNE